MPRTLLPLLTLSLATFMSPAATDTERTEAIRDYIAELAGPLRVPPEPFEVSFEYGLRALRSADDLRQALEPLADRPDHPDRRDLDQQLALAIKPQEVSATFAYESPRTWAIDEFTEDGVLRLGELDGVRWIWYDTGENDGQMTLTRAGVPFPPGFNVGLMFRSHMRNLRRLTNAGVPQGDYNLIAIDPAPGVWTVMIEHIATGDRLRLEGEWRDGLPLARGLDRYFLSDGGVATTAESIELQPPAAADAIASAWFYGASTVRNDGIIKWISLSAAKNVSLAAVESRAHHPAEVAASEPDVVIRDYRNAAAAERDTRPGSTMLIFQPGEPAHRVDQPASNESADAASTPTPNDPLTPANAAPAADGDEPRGRSTVFVAVATVVVGGIMLAVVRLLRSRHAP